MIRKLRRVLQRSSRRRKKKIRLRHVFRLGFLMGKQAEAFYRRFERKVNDADLKKLCLGLADDHAEHLKFIKKKLSSWETLPPRKGHIEAMDHDGQLRDAFKSPPSPKASKKEIVEYAISQEKKIVDFYNTSKTKLPVHWKYRILSEMVAQKREHVQKLLAMLSEL
jgi:rubrerythrin